MRSLLIFLLFSAMILARYDAPAVQVCGAFDNLKQSKNTHGVMLEAGKQYTVLEKHKGKYLVLIKGENPAQRWVDTECFDKSSADVTSQVKTPKEETIVQAQEVQNNGTQNLLALSWHNAFCQTHQYKRECKRSLFLHFEKSRFVLHGLWPQPRNNIYCNVDLSTIETDKRGQWNALPVLQLDEDTKEKLVHHMPGAISNLQRHEWYKHGSCYGGTPQAYFTDEIRFIEQFNAAKINTFFQNNEGKYVTLAQVRYIVERSFGMGTGKRVEMRCNGGLITELWLHLGSGSDDLATLLKRGKPVNSYCRGGIVDSAGF